MGIPSAKKCCWDWAAGLASSTGSCTGVQVRGRNSSSLKRSRATLVDQLQAGQPVMLQADMGFLPYFDFGGNEFHFGGHVVVACGYDSDTDTVDIADRDGVYSVPMADLAQARNSSYKPFPPKNRWWSFDFANKRPPTADEIRQAIRAQTEVMLNPPIRNIGVAGIRKAADMVPKWTKSVDPDQFRSALFNGFVFINAKGGTGGGLFRYMFGRFLAEAAEITGDAVFADSAERFREIGDDWEQIAAWFYAQFESTSPEIGLGDIRPMLRAIADQEEQAWNVLRGC
jgi:hypothetical protein